MVEFGAKPIEAIQFATVNAAKLLSLDGRAGTVVSGSFADLIAVDSDPRVHVEALENVKFVMKAGKIYKDDWQPALAIPNR